MPIPRPRAGPDNKGGRLPHAAVVLRAARQKLGWSQARLGYEMVAEARRRGTPLPSPRSLRSLISRWECGRQAPDSYHRFIVCAALGIDSSELDAPQP